MNEVSTILGPDGKPATPPPLPSWVAALRPNMRVVIAGWWFKVEDSVTNGEGQWAMILSPVGPTAATKRRIDEAAKVQRGNQQNGRRKR